MQSLLDIHVLMAPHLWALSTVLPQAAGKHCLQNALSAVVDKEIISDLLLGKHYTEPQIMKPVFLSLLAKQWSHPCCLQIFYLQCSRVR